ncbi:MAG: hypothetical protein DMD80_18565 [Candidatus Rokuibacteriota bacterium]|nr:MAG: hypothetical protein DMD80_18565 [Candidatus Rokubacteria bacterium]
MTRALLVLALLVLLVGCASSSSPPPQQHPRAGSSPRVRCLTNPNETELRPLFFLFCVESP